MTLTRPFPGRHASVLAGLLCLAALPASASTDCEAQAESLRAAQEDVVERQSARDALVGQVEEAGEEWQSAESMRLFSEAHAREAMVTKKDYEALKAELAAMDEDLQADAASVNAQVEAFNATCATER